MLAVAIIALAFSLLSLAWNAYIYFHPGRFDVRVTVDERLPPNANLRFD